MENSVTTLIKRVGTLDKADYEIVRNSILKNLLAYGAMTSEQLASLVENRLKYRFNGLLPGYYAAVLYNLEVRGEIRRLPNTTPPLIEMNM